MSSVRHLREFISDRLTAAASEIFSEFEKTILRYEEEIDRQRRLLDVSWKPELKLHRVGLQTEPVHDAKLILTGQQLCDQERSSSLDQEEPELQPPEIKEEHEDSKERPLPNKEEQERERPQQELCTDQEGAQLHLKQETGPFMVTVSFEESEAEPDGEQLIYQSSAGPEDQDLESDENAERPLKKTDHTDGRHGNKTDQPATSERLFSCQICGETFTDNSRLIHHIKVHSVRSQNSDRLLYCCPTCGKNFSACCQLVIHMRCHSGEKPFSCIICGQKFPSNGDCKKHMRIHSGEKLYSCRVCGKTFSTKGSSIVHMRRHAGEKPFSCKFCGKQFTTSGDCKRHVMIHTGEKPFFCQTCGKSFNRTSHLTRHMKVHRLELIHNQPIVDKT